MNGQVKTFSPLIVSVTGSSKAHCFASGMSADTIWRKKKELILNTEGILGDRKYSKESIPNQ